MQQLLTKALISEFKRVGSQEKNNDPIVIAKFFFSNAVWLATEYDPINNKTFFGYVDLFQQDDCAEWGYFSLEELQSYIGKYNSRIERDLYFKSEPISIINPRAFRLIQN